MLAPLLLLALLESCAAAPVVEGPALELPIPDSWSIAAGDPEALSGPWWTSFGDPRLDELVEEALGSNFDLRAAAAAVDAALATARAAGADLKPQVAAGFDASRRQQIFVGLPFPTQGGPLESVSSFYGVSLNLSWEADLWGRLRAGKAAAVRDAEAARADYSAARLSLAGQAVKAWFTVMEAERQVELADDTVASRTTTKDRIAARYRHGVAVALDLRLARSNLAQAESARELRRRQLDAARRQLEILLGRYPAGRLAAEVELPDIPAEIPAGLPAELLIRRPDLQAAERRLEATGLRVLEARRALYPRLSLTASGGTSSDSLGDLTGGNFSVWNLAGGLLQPIFQGGRLRAVVELADASREQALAGYAQSVLRALAEVETALAAEGFLAVEEAAQATVTEESQAAARLAEDRYRAGVGDYLSILESQRQAFISESRQLTLRALRLRNRVDLHLALGGDFGPGRPQPPTSILSPLIRR